MDDFDQLRLEPEHPRLGYYFNASRYFNVSSTMLSSIFSLPSRVLSRMHKMHDLYAQDPAFVGVATRNRARERVALYAGTASPDFPTLPTPWPFMTSGYVLMLALMVVLLNRIHNIVVPPRRELHRQRPERSDWKIINIARAIWYSMFPVNLSSTLNRGVLRLPTIFFLARAMLLWILTLLQVSHSMPTWDFNWFSTISGWVASKEMEVICWQTFMAVCAALVVDALTKGLEGQTNSSSASPFNLFGYAFLLHVYSQPVTHEKTQGSPSRPDKHIIVTIAIPLLQLLLTHTTAISERWSNYRLIPTFFTSMLNLVHFHFVVWFTNDSYPLLNYLPSVFESLLISVIALVMGLNALTQVLLEGEITRPLFAHRSTLVPRWDEDWPIVLIRMGTASFEATSVSGLGNEVGSVNSAQVTLPEEEGGEHGSVQIGPSGVVAIKDGVHTNRRGFGNEIRRIRSARQDVEIDHIWLDTIYYRELANFGLSILKAGRNLARISWKAVWRQSSISEIQEKPTSSSRSTPTPRTFSAEGLLYHQFLTGDVSDDEDDEFVPTVGAMSRDRSVTPFSDDGSHTGSEDEGQESKSPEYTETAALYADLALHLDASSSTPLLLAHMTSPSASPLTRKQYSMLMVDGRDDLSQTIRQRRQNGSTRPEDGASDNTARNCVICMSEPRQIICWPCRCLALCDDCRENLATRSSASYHLCPCCRNNVEGYSRIFVP